MDTTSIQKLLVQASKVEVIATRVTQYSEPIQLEYEYEGNNKFTKAFAQVINTSSNDIVHLYVTEVSGSWNHRYKIDRIDFIKCFAFEVLQHSLSQFASVMFRNSNGYSNDAVEKVKAGEAEVYNAHDDGQFFWKNLIAQESAVAEAKAKAEALAKEIIDGKSTSKSAQPFDDFGSGNPSV